MKASIPIILLGIAAVSNVHAAGCVLSSNRVDTGMAIAPVPLDLSHKNPRYVGMGSYIVNSAGGCNDCHTNPPYAPGGDPFKGEPEKINTAGYLAGGTAFGPFVSRNLTPCHNGRPEWSYAEFVDMMRHGTDMDNPGQTLQVMPWPNYGKMTDCDLRAVYEYLRAIPPQSCAVP